MTRVRVLVTAAVAWLVGFSIACLPAVTAQKINRLAESSSPYLKHHAHNPVDWYPWGQEAFARARRENKPIILSIGYGACHWCNLMERESFEDKRIAAYMNQHFINVKVDKDQLPDVDFTYQSASQNMTGTGGWPLTVFMTPDRKPFFIATYITPGSFKALMSSLVKKWSDQRPQLLTSAEQAAAVLHTKGMIRLQADEPEAAVILPAMCEKILKSADTIYGGIGAGSKFPMPTVFELAMLASCRQSAAVVDAQSQLAAGKFVQTTLDNMACGTLQDQIGGGFFRYCQGRAWTRPHFEKLLIDNAAIADCYLQGYRLTGSPYWRQVAACTIDFVLREMLSPQGLFYNSISADSDQREGQYYYMKRSQVLAALGAQEGGWAGDLFAIKEDLSVPRLSAPPEKLAQQMHMGTDQFFQRLAADRQKLWQMRLKRTAPAVDTQVVTAHNALMIHTLVAGYRTLGEQRYLEAAKRSATVLLAKMYQGQRLSRSFGDTRAGAQAYLDDYALLVRALVDLSQVDPDGPWLSLADRLTATMVQTFLDKKSGLWRSSAGAGARLTVGTIPTDTVAPAAPAVATLDLIELARLTDAQQHMSIARKVLATYAPAYAKSWLHSTFVQALDFCQAPVSEVIVLANGNAAAARPLQAVVGKTYLPHSTIIFADSASGAGKPARLPLLSFLQGHANNMSAVYICKKRACQAPVTDATALPAALSQL